MLHIIPGRYPISIYCNNTLAVHQSESLADYFEDKLHTQEVSFTLNEDTCYFGIVFNGEILDDIEAQKRIIRGVNEFLKQKNIEVHLQVKHFKQNTTFRSLPDVVIHWPFIENMDISDVGAK